MKTVLMLISLFSLTSFGHEIACPALIKTKQTSVESLNNEWLPFELNPDQNDKLESFSLYSGHPKEMAALKPDLINGKEIWKISKDDPDGFWILCRYGRTRITLIKKLPMGLSQCVYKQKDKQIGPLHCQ